ncbi:anhydro-N-acetylmuramic acid kinase [Putridiphycobacter roseus]|uniref:Anhydro-N-acetylmuramic acid kinase n=1 Tax=Putridiphycobacter roseus TaxID=2219161 RepID=A0A2W1NR56_9FLAO|nr:anhydro-N-acetylmuramic acid kinase [Putridiphycobacter roseus]PZE17168.1 anhydro-N-acetylmuramic acid kinase [Putridiphycobacter roseus]
MNILGLMSGTSLDGLDLCLVKFEVSDDQYNFSILESETIPYPNLLAENLKKAVDLSSEDLLRLDVELGRYFGEKVLTFQQKFDLEIDYIASHGHTVFHQPENGFTLQIGCGNQLFAQTNIPVIYDFRSQDVALGGQGAPLVPIGDLHLFQQYVACINFGGIANLSFQSESKRLAFDICPVNMAFSYLTNQLNLPYDDGGMIAKSGEVNRALLMQLNELEFYQAAGPKSLGLEWFNANVLPLLQNENISIPDKLRTMVQHIAIQIANVLSELGNGKVLVSGGGVYNVFLMEQIKAEVRQEIVIPTKEIIEFKEALIFAFLGYLKVHGKVNVLQSVTGASKDSVSGILVS